MSSSSSFVSPIHRPRPSTPHSRTLTPLSLTSGQLPLAAGLQSPKAFTSPGDAGSDTTNGATKPKQKRNKPTLSCDECVERKTKCDRARPLCVACVKRQSECHYSYAANTSPTAKSATSRHSTKSPIRARHRATTSVPQISLVTKDVHGADKPLDNPLKRKRTFARASPSVMSPLPFSESSPSNIFGVGADFPFSNYWTCAGGIAEVVGVLPSKQQADILINRFLEVIDPVYPFIHRRTLMIHYERFWASPDHLKNNAEPDLVAIHCAIYALGTQFMQFPSYTDRSQSAEFYASAAFQALRLYSYLNRASLRSLGAMLLLAYFLMNDNHASDAYAWAGSLLRQAYVLRLNRDPDLLDLNISEIEKQTRRKMWQAVYFQDTFLTVLLKLPPTALHSDVQLELLQDEASLSADGFGRDLAFQSRVENLMSINMIAPPPNASTSSTILPADIDLNQYSVSPATDRADVEYICSMWKLGSLVQNSISSPLSLNLPLASSPREKAALVASFQSLHASFPSWLTTTDSNALTTELRTNPRGVRQNLFLTSNYYHCVMVLQACENEDAHVELDVEGSLHAAHEALASYFKLAKYFDTEAQVWWVFQHRAFEEALTIARLLALPPPSPTMQQQQQHHHQQTSSGDSADADALRRRCRDDVAAMIELLRNSTVGHAEMRRDRLTALEAAFERCLV